MRASSGLVKAVSVLNGLQRFSASHVLLYHATYREVPASLRKDLHNVSPDVLFEQLTWLKKYFDVVPVDRLFEPDIELRGKAAITFDDGYKSVFDEALPVIESLAVPCTIFVNTVTLSGRPIWRDKIRYLINNSLVDEFVRFCRAQSVLERVTVDAFYRSTKSPHVNSSTVDRMCSLFMAERKLDMLERLDYGVDDPSRLVAHPMVTYGNHTHNHYVMSSLTEAEQDAEIATTHGLLASKRVRMSRVFSIPFGGDTDFDSATIRLLKKYDYIGFLYSRSALNMSSGHLEQRLGNCAFRERYMVASEFGTFQTSIAKLFVRGLSRRRHS